MSHSVADNEPLLTFSFSAGGWFQLYLCGVSNALKDSGVLDTRSVRLCGSSAGALAVAALVGNIDFDTVPAQSVECSEDCRAHWWNVFRMRHYLLKSIRRFGPDAVAPGKKELVLQNSERFRTEIYGTTLPFLKKKIFHGFEDLSDIEEALSATCCFTPCAGLPIKLRKTGEWAIDGGVSAFQPRKGEPNTITISPFYFGDSDIKPSVPFPVWWAIRPPPQEQYIELFHAGYADCIQYLLREGLILAEPTIAASKLKKGREISHRYHRGGSRSLIVDAAVIGVLVFILRPIVVGILYAELFLKVILDLVCFVFSWEFHLPSVQQLGCAISHLWHPMLFLRLHFFPLFGIAAADASPEEDQHLWARSRVFRFFGPLIFHSKVYESPKTK
jgi:hypothetical protein